MLSNAPVSVVVPTTDMQVAKEFYGNTLGLRQLPIEDGPVLFEAGRGTTIEVYERAEPTRAEHTVAEFRVTDIARVVEELERKGVVFEDYEGSVNHVIEYGQAKAAWFKDPDGNILALGEDPRL